MDDYYEILGVLPSVSQGEIKKSFRHLARSYHPDINHASDAHERMALINKAYHILCDAEKRAKYDQLLITLNKASKVAPLHVSQHLSLNQRWSFSFFQQQSTWKLDTASALDTFVNKVIYAYETHGYTIARMVSRNPTTTDLLMRRKDTMAIARLHVTPLVSPDEVKALLKNLPRLTVGAYITTGFFVSRACSDAKAQKLVCYNGADFIEIYSKALKKRVQIRE